MIERRLSRFLREPASVRNAVSVIVAGTGIAVVAGGLLMRVLDPSEYPNVGRGLWWAMQTMTTVGYGDVTPENVSGRLIASVVMLWGIAFLAILTAVITSVFVTRAAAERAQVEAGDDDEVEEQIETSLEDIAARLDRVEQLLAQIANR
jgi:voltage-gated potassium channel Kch